MFEKLGQFANLMKNLPRIKEEMERLRGRLGQLTADGDAGGGMVKFRVNGNLEVLNCTLSEEVMKLNDRELMEDLIAAAANQALQKARQMVAAETTKMASELGLPAGMDLPGLGG